MLVWIRPSVLFHFSHLEGQQQFGWMGSRTLEAHDDRPVLKRVAEGGDPQSGRTRVGVRFSQSSICVGFGQSSQSWRSNHSFCFSPTDHSRKKSNWTGWRELESFLIQLTSASQQAGLEVNQPKCELWGKDVIIPDGYPLESIPVAKWDDCTTLLGSTFFR